MKYQKIALFFLPFLVLSCLQDADKQMFMEVMEDNMSILKIHEDYVKGWKNGDEKLVLSLFEGDAMIQPNSLQPKKGKEELSDFWFPKDGSITTIDSFETRMINLEILDTIAVTTHHSYLDWNYEKDSTEFGMIQKGIVTTVYRRQTDDSWLIWRQMWTDIYRRQK